MASKKCSCGAPLAPNQKFCTKCGKRVDETNGNDASSGIANSSSANGGRISIGAGIAIAAAIVAVAAVVIVVLIAPIGRSGGDQTTDSSPQPTVSQSPSPSAKSSPSPSSSANPSSSSKSSGKDVTISVKTKSGTTLTGTVHQQSDGYVISNSSTHEYTESEIKALKLNAAELAVARNEIYARIGYSFSNSGLRSYFKNCSWYSDSGSKPSLPAGGVAEKNALLLLEISKESDSTNAWVELSQD